MYVGLVVWVLLHIGQYSEVPSWCYTTDKFPFELGRLGQYYLVCICDVRVLKPIYCGCIYLKPKAPT